LVWSVDALGSIFDIEDTPRLRIGFFIFICLLSFIAFGGLLEHPMNVVGDEPAAIQDARLILDNPFNWTSTQRVMVVRPPVDLFFLIGVVLWDASDAGYQAFQIVLHIIASWFVFCVLRRLQIDMTVCLIAAVFFLLNVAHFRAVQWVMCVNYNLACIFALSSVWFLLRYFETDQPRFWFGVIGMVWCAVFSHPASVVVVLFHGYIIWQKKRSLHLILIVLGAGVAFTGLAFLASPNHAQVQGVVNEIDLRRLFINPIWYLGRLITSAHWLPYFATQNEPNVYEMIVGVLFFISVVWLFLRRRDWILTHWAVWTVIMVLPFVNNASDRQIVGPSRQLYFASVGSSVVLAWFMCSLCQKLKEKRIQKIVLVGWSFILILLSVVSLEKSEALDYWLVGRSYVASRQIDKGMVLFGDAYDHGRDILPVNFYTQSAILAFGVGQSMLDRLQYALDIYPGDAHVTVLLGVLHFMSDDPDERKQGQAQIASALQNAKNKQGLIQDLTAALQNSAAYLHENHQYDRAIELYQQVLNVRPKYVIALVNMGRAYFAKEAHEKGILAVLRATELQPDFWEAWQLLGNLLRIIGDYENAISALQSAHHLNEALVDLPYTIGFCHEQLGRQEESKLWYYKALKIDPDHTESIQRLSALSK
jgi:tetratricopeptide (TPR) repeat protein